MFFGPKSNFSAIFDALVRPNLQSWTFWGLNSDDFPFFKPYLALLEAELAPFKDWEEIGNIWDFRKFLSTRHDDDDDDLL